MDFDIKDGKAIEIYITSMGNFSQDSNDNRDDEDDSDEEISIFEDKDNKFFHKGIVSNYRKEVVSHTSGEIKVSGVRRLPSGHIEGGGGGGSISTTHHHTVYFDIGNKSFAWSGNNPISNDDEVVLCATSMQNGYYYVECLKNITKGLFFEKNYLKDSAYISCCKKFPLFALAGLFWLGCFVMFMINGLVIKGIAIIICSILGYVALVKVPRRIIVKLVVLVALVALYPIVSTLGDTMIAILFLSIIAVVGTLGLEVVSNMRDMRER